VTRGFQFNATNCRNSGDLQENNKTYTRTARKPSPKSPCLEGKQTTIASLKPHSRFQNTLPSLLHSIPLQSTLSPWNCWCRRLHALLLPSFFFPPTKQRRRSTFFCLPSATNLKLHSNLQNVESQATSDSDLGHVTLVCMKWHNECLLLRAKPWFLQQTNPMNFLQRMNPVNSLRQMNPMNLLQPNS
jgi:hypothetical protein